MEARPGNRSALRTVLARFAIDHLPGILNRLEELETENEARRTELFSLRAKNAAWEEGYSKQLLELDQLKGGVLLGREMEGEL